jgi:hypothetical protein
MLLPGVLGIRVSAFALSTTRRGGRRLACFFSEPSCNVLVPGVVELRSLELAANGVELVSLDEAVRISGSLLGWQSLRAGGVEEGLVENDNKTNLIVSRKLKVSWIVVFDGTSVC